MMSISYHLQSGGGERQLDSERPQPGEGVDSLATHASREA